MGVGAELWQGAAAGPDTLAVPGPAIPQTRCLVPYQETPPEMAVPAASAEAPASSVEGQAERGVQQGTASPTARHGLAAAAGPGGAEAGAGVEVL